METHSRNFIAEQVVKLLGFAAGCRPATFSCGLAVIRQTMRRFGVDPECTRLENGSGLFSADEVSPAQVVRFLLSTLNRKDIAGPFLKTLAIGGKTGTLKDLLKNVKRPVLAKTGTLDDVSALAGIIDRGEGRTIVFAILMNGCSDNSTEEIRNVQDRMVGRLAKWGQPDKKRH